MSMEWYLNGELLKDNEAYEYLTMKRKMLISLRDHMQEKTATISDVNNAQKQPPKTFDRCHANH